MLYQQLLPRDSSTIELIMARESIVPIRKELDDWD